jgi:uncharacterized damage-inducible protein DinB
MQDDIVALFAYDRWANRKVLDACRKLTAEQYVAEPVSNCQMLWMTANSGGVGLLHPIDKPHPGDHLC